jgi:magnesium transporter
MLTIFPGDHRAPDTAVWIDLLEPSAEELARARDEFGVEVPSRQQLEEIESSSRLRSEGEVLTLSMTVASKSDSDEPMPTPIGFILTPKLLLTVRYAEVHAFRRALDIMSKEAPPKSADMFVTLIEAMVDYAADVLEAIGTRLNATSRQVFHRDLPGQGRAAGRFNQDLKRALLDVGEAGERLSHIRESILGLQRIAPFVSGCRQNWVGESVPGRLDIVARDLQSLADFEVHLTDKVQFLLDAVLGFISTEQNDIFKVLTIVSVVGIPPTLIASMYGMNFDTIHEYHWHYGYAWGLFLILISAIVPTAWFKWRGWW